MNENVRALLISNSTLHGGGYFDHVIDDVCEFLGERRRLLFFPFALHDYDSYAAKVAARFVQVGIAVVSAHRFDTAEPHSAMPRRSSSAAATLFGC